MTTGQRIRPTRRERATAQAQAAVESSQGGTESAPYGTVGAVLSSLIVLFAAIGIPIAIYLTVQHYEGVAPSCPKADWFARFLANFKVGINCGAVTSSPYSRVGPTNIPITVPGLIWFVGSGALGVWALLSAAGKLARPNWLFNAHLAWAAIGLAFIIYLVYIEFAVLHLVCEWCTGVHVLTLLTFVVVLIQWQRQMAARYRT